jgi:GT2 family glycosyltransferase
VTPPGFRCATPAVSAVVPAFGPEPLLERCVAALLDSTGTTVEVVVVDNGCTSDAVRRVRGRAGVRVLEPGRNTGFTGGCHLGADSALGATLMFVNSDAVVEPGAAAALEAALADPGVGIATGSLRLLERPATMNSAGNPVHFLGLSWAGGLGDPASAHASSGPVAAACGALMALRRTTWRELGGFYRPLFAYCEDLELSLRCWLSGRSVQYVPEAVALHAYEFHRNPLKMHLLERNRLLVVLTVYAMPTLWLLSLPLLALELALLAVALRQGWARQKLGGWWWLLRHAGSVAARRRAVQQARRSSDGVLATLLTGAFTPGEELGLRVARPLQALSTGYWAVVRRAVGRLDTAS